MSRPWIITEIITNEDQVIRIQPTPGGDNCIEFSFSGQDDENDSGILYINKEELPYVIQKMQEMMEYVTK